MGWQIPNLVVNITKDGPISLTVIQLKNLERHSSDQTEKNWQEQTHESL